MEEKILLAIEGLKQDFNHKIESLTGKVDSLTGKTNSLSDKVDSLTGKTNSLSDKVDSLTGKTNSLSDKVDSLGNQVNENTQILKALEHLAQVNKSEHDRMTFELAEIRSEVKSMRKDLSTVELVTANNWSDIVKLKSIK